MNVAMEVHMRQTIVRLLSGMGSAREIQQYLERFSQLDAKRFALVKVGGAVLGEELESLTSSLAFLQQVGLTPVVVHGAGPQLDEALAKAGIERRTVNGLRVTSPQALGVVRRIFHQQNLRLVEALHNMGTRATSIVSGVFNASYLDREHCGLVGQVDSVDLTSIDASVRLSSIPVIASLGETQNGQILNINADFAAHALVRALTPYKIVFLTGSGGLLDENDQIIDSINLSTEFDHLMAQPWLHGGMRLKLEQVAALLDELPPSSSVSITRPSQLARELFTHKGSGTLVRKGEKVHRHTGWEGVDRVRMRDLIESSFGRTLAPDYFDRVQPHMVYVSNSYRAAMVILDVAGLPYLDKFAVLADAQGEGLGRAVWQAMRVDHPRLFWRSRRDNFINPFYNAECDGAIKKSHWTVYWYGLEEDFDTIARCVAECERRQPTLTG